MKKKRKQAEERLVALKRVGGLYKILPGAASNCVYCGVPGGTWDHVPPLSWAYALGPSYFWDQGIELFKVRACIECNSFLGDRQIFTVDDRRAYVKKRIERKYRKLIAGGRWEQEELAELGRNLQTMIARWSDAQLVLDRRLAYAAGEPEVPA